MRKEVIFIVKIDEDGEYIAKAIGYSIFTQGSNEQEVRDNILDAVQCHFDSDEMPESIKIQFVKEEILACA